jgi:hypothetical protein
MHLVSSSSATRSTHNSETLHAPMLAASDPRRNRLLAALPKEQWRRWSRHLEALEMPLGSVLAESSASLSHVYFPTTAVASLLYVMASGGVSRNCHRWQ